MKKSIKKAYADLLVESGIALKKGQSVYINASVENEEFTALVVDKCYKMGAKRVVVDWFSEKTDRIALKRGKKSELAKVTPWVLATRTWMTEEFPCRLFLYSNDPDANKGLNEEKIAYIRREQMKVLYPLREMIENKHQWCIAGVPGAAWAKKVFPNLPKGKAIEAMWEAILKTSRALDGNGIKNWVDHDVDLKKRCAYLNSLNLRELHYTSKGGTDFTVGLIPGVIFLGGGEKTLDGTYFQPNIPSEECFTSPRKGEAEGIVYSAKPLVYQGNVIDKFWIKFKGGKAVDCHAEVGEDTLRSIISIDEGAAYLGECALVPYTSPINMTGLLFYNTLFDENAACHLALGHGFTNLYPGFENMTQEEIYEKGINKSASHVDFMIGSKDLDIVGIDDKGKQHQLFKDGVWAF